MLFEFSLRNLPKGGVMETWHLALLLCCLAVVLLTSRSPRKTNPRSLPLPPGPKPWPLIGNLFDMPLHHPWSVYASWTKEYGDIIYFKVLGQSFLVLNSARRCADLFDKRSANYSDRLHSEMVVDLMGGEYNVALQQYGARWRRHRRLLHEFFNPHVVEKYKHIQQREARNLVRILSKTSADLKKHIRFVFAASVMDICYGLRIRGYDDPLLLRADLAMERFAEAAIPGRYFVEFMPFLKHVPSWLPGAGFKRVAEETKEMQKKIVRLPFQEVVDMLERGEVNNSVAAELYKKLPPKDDPRHAEELETAQNVAVITYLAGADTSVATMLVFLLAMALHPEAMKKAQEEIDFVVGNSRLPDYTADRDSLVYVTAVMKECMRWQLVAPIALPHRTTNDDEYDGYFIPKNTAVIGNAWAIMHDEALYDDPFVFNPDRFIKNGQFDHDMLGPESGAFGFGRRLCPGQALAQGSMWGMMAALLAVFDILPPIDEKGQPVELTCKMLNGVVSYPDDFNCRILPRNDRAPRELISFLAMD